MPYSPAKIANYFLDLADKSGKELSHLKLQKLLYFSHGWYLALSDEGRPLFASDIEAWPYGPVIESIYQQFTLFGKDPIVGFRAHDLVYKSGEMDKEKVHVNYNLEVVYLDDEEKKIIGPLLDRIWEIYSPLSAYRLAHLTHLPGTPWRKLFDENDGIIPKNTVITNNDIREYFLDKLRRAKEENG